MGRGTPRPDWVSLSEASRLLGVSPATVRRWSDAGRLRAFTTPGGHRRFSRATLLSLLPADRTRRPAITSAGLTPSRIARSYRRASRELSTELPWVLALTDEQRGLFRDRGQVLARSLLQHLDADEPENAEHHLKSAAVSASEYGDMAAALESDDLDRGARYIDGDLRFHLAIAEATRNGVVLHTMDALRGVIRRALMSIFLIPQSPERSFEQHRSIRNAIAARDAVSAAVEAQRQHATNLGSPAANGGNDG